MPSFFYDIQGTFIAIDRKNWCRINLFMVSIIWDKRAFPIYFTLLPKLGSSNVTEQKDIITKVIPLFYNYEVKNTF